MNRNVPRLATVLAVLLAVLVMAMPLTDSDLHLHLAMGRIFSLTGVPGQDALSWTAAGTPWTPHEWLWSLALWQVWQRTNSEGMWLLKLLLWMIPVLLALRACPGERRDAVFLGSWSLALLAGAALWTLRPHVVMLIGLLALVRSAGRQLTLRRAALTALGFALWANLHASVLMGLGLWLLLRLPQWRCAGRRELAGLLLLALATLANPAGARLWLWPLSLLRDGKAGFVEEWGGFTAVAATLPGIMFIALTLLTLALVLQAVRQRQALPWRELLLWLGFTVWALASRRMVAPAALLAVLTVAMLPRRVRPELVRARWLLAVACLAFLGWWQLPVRERFAVRRENLVVAVQQLPSSAAMAVPRPGAAPLLVAGHLFHPYEWGGVLLFERWPECRTFVDGRTEVFPSQLLADYGILFRAGTGWRELLDRYEIDAAWLPAGAPLAAALAADRWQLELLPGGSLYLTRPNVEK
ncbi:MAG TPA: hypothetical protein PKM88_12300 [bacterium]|nr:hypothetical protein [bacterium]